VSQAARIPETVAWEPRTGRSLWADACRRLVRDKSAVVCFVIICLYTIIAILAPIVFSDWAEGFDYDNVNAPPSWSEPLGTDALGRSVYQKTLLSASTSMTVGFMANVIAIPLGMVLGAIAGYYGGFLDDVIVWLYTTLASIPGIVRLLALKFAFVGMVLWKDTWFEVDLGGTAGIYVALGVMSWVGTCRLVRAEAMKLRELDYVVAARAAGRRSASILFRHIVPNLLHLAIINFSLGFVYAIGAEVFLSFLNLGPKDRPSWGQMIDAAKMDLIVGRWWEIAAASGAMFLIVLVWNIFGDRLRDALDPRLRGV
jgi:peptide/nickel transport system permease protein